MCLKPKRRILTLCGCALPVGTNWVSSREKREGVRFHGSSDAAPKLPPHRAPRDLSQHGAAQDVPQLAWFQTDKVAAAASETSLESARGSSRVVAECSRSGPGEELRLPHGPVAPSVHARVGTQATMKGITAEQLDALGCRICRGQHLPSGSEGRWVGCAPAERKRAAERGGAQEIP